MLGDLFGGEAGGGGAVGDDVFGGFFFQAEDGIRDYKVTGVQTCALPISISQPRTGSFTQIRSVRCRKNWFAPISWNSHSWCCIPVRTSARVKKRDLKKLWNRLIACFPVFRKSKHGSRSKRPLAKAHAWGTNSSTLRTLSAVCVNQSDCVSASIPRMFSLRVMTSE